MEIPGENLLIKMWETLSEKGVGGLLKPWQIKRDGMAHIEMRRAELLALAQTEKDIESIKAGHKSLEDFSREPKFARKLLNKLPIKQRIEPTLDFSSVIEVAMSQKMEDSIRREINVAKTIAYAEEILKDDPQEPPSRKIDDDWLYRWRDYAGEVSTEEMQHLWANLLTGELKSPGSHTLRCLDFLRNLSQSEAKSIENLARFVVDEVIWKEADELMESEGLSFQMLLEMQNLGIILGVGSTGIDWNKASCSQENFINSFDSNGKTLIVKHKDANKSLSIKGVYVLTSIGKQIIKLGNFEPHFEYLNKLGKYLVSQGFDVSLADFVRLSEDKIQIFNEKPITI